MKYEPSFGNYVSSRYFIFPGVKFFHFFMLSMLLVTVSFVPRGDWCMIEL